MGIFKNIFGKPKKKIHLSRCNYNEYFDNIEFNGIPLTLLSLGELAIPTGQIIVCDPLVHYYNSLPLDKKVKPGKYPVTVCIAQTKDSGHRYAAVKLEFSKHKAVNWQLATTEGQDVKELLVEDEFFGFPVDAGLGCLMDFETNDFYIEFNDNFIKHNPNGNLYDDLLAEEFNKNADPNNLDDIGDWLNFQLPNKPELNIVMFHSGFGDGVYPSYWGLTKTGEICNLVIDFCVA